jgi:hypothetical protein
VPGGQGPIPRDPGPCDYDRDMPIDQQRRLEEAAAAAHTAQDRGDIWAANDAWRRYVLIEDAMRDPQDLLDEGVALSKIAIDLWQQR